MLGTKAALLARVVRSKILILLVLMLLAGAGARAQTCQTFSGLTYATYQDSGGQTKELKLELLVPSGAGLFPVVVWIHGGGWISGSRLPIPSYVSALCNQGYAVASVDYRYSDAAVWPAQIQDCRGAVRWLRAHAGTYNLDPDRFAAWGSSAGAHLASMLGTAGGEGTVRIGSVAVDLEGSMGGNTGQSSRVQAVVDWFGQSDFLQMYFYPSLQDHNARLSPEGKLIGDWIQKNPDRVATANPITWASPDDPPFLVMHGTVDDTVPFNQSELLVDALRHQGVRVTWKPVAGAGHGFTTPAENQAVYDFLAANLLNLPDVTVRVDATDASASEAGSGTGTFTVSRTGSTAAMAAPLTVAWAPAGTARLGADYSLAAPWSVTIPAGAASAALTLRPVNDALVEGDETVVLRLASGASYRIDASGASAAATISDDDGDDGGAGLPVATVAATDASASETGPDNGSFTISVDPAPESDLTVLYSVSGTATNGEDYAALNGRVVIPAGFFSAPVPIAVQVDERLEPAESVILTLEASSSYSIGSTPAAGVKLVERDWESTLPRVSVSATDPSASEPGGASGAFTVSRTGSTSGSLLVDLLVGGSAKGGSDFANLPSTVMFGSGVSRLNLLVEVRDDSLVEGPETVHLTVLPDTGIRLGPYAGMVTIADDEPSAGVDGFYPLPPCRLVDTRDPAGAWGAPRMASGETRVFEVGGRCGIPPEATALSLNVTVIGSDSPGYVTLFEAGALRPVASTVNVQAGQNRANNAILKLTGHPLSLAAYCGASSGGFDLLLDVTGYFR